MNSTNQKCVDASIAGNMNGMDISLKRVRSGDFILCLTDGLLDHLTMDRHSTMKEYERVMNNIMGELMLQIVKDVSSADEVDRSAHLKKIFVGFQEYSAALAKVKLEQDIIRECELDDVGCIALLVPFFDIFEDGNLYRFFKPNVSPLAPPKRPWGDVIKTIFGGKTLHGTTMEEDSPDG